MQIVSLDTRWRTYVVYRVKEHKRRADFSGVFFFFLKPEKHINFQRRRRDFFSPFLDHGNNRRCINDLSVE